ncbi:MAG: response regulator [Desulfobacteraceae bacterium]|uniref:Response regulator n=1 Tax=Candidatus Desulfacyla euxinica TaxID=2841693 RepID=A0A8J6N045_9DELT|nr:response regulator [Candidatus Desulfacyla euxinica]MBL6979194.1 response regulator [Desulfobacteraceae bacterium]
MESNAKILVIDDEIKICDNVEKILSKSGFEVAKALSAREAMEKMAKEAFSLLISDIVMPETNGLELLRLVKEQWPLSKVIMMTAYASTDTAMKAVRMGALDYVPKPFTPDELRSTVKKALAGELVEAPTTEKERKAIDLIDIDIPFEREDVAKYTGEAYADMLGPSDMPVVAIPSAESLPNYCLVGEMSCDIFMKLGKTCKVGLKTSECPQKAAKKKKAQKKAKGFDPEKMIGIDQPFEYDAVSAVTGPEYVRNLHQEGVAFVPYEELKQTVAGLLEKAPKDLPVPIELMAEPPYKNILVIDDEVAVNNNIRKILSKKGYHVDQAVTKAEALEAIQKRHYRLVLLDLKIPGVTGLELLKAIRDKQPETMVIIITGYASIETAVETARMGTFDYLAKPFTPAEIRNITEKAFQMAA